MENDKIVFQEEFDDWVLLFDPDSAYKEVNSFIQEICEKGYVMSSNKNHLCNPHISV